MSVLNKMIYHKSYVKVWAPTEICNYYQVIKFGSVVALCPTEETAIYTADAIQFYTEHLPRMIVKPNESGESVK